MRPKPGHVWRYQAGSWKEVPTDELGVADMLQAAPRPLNRDVLKVAGYPQPSYEGPIVGFNNMSLDNSPNGMNETVTSHDAVKEYLTRTLVMECTDSFSWSAIRFYEDVLLWRAFGDPVRGTIDPEVFENLDDDECIRLNQSLKYIKKLCPEELAFTVMIAIQEMEF